MKYDNEIQSSLNEEKVPKISLKKIYMKEP